MSTIDDVRALGYEITVAFTLADTAVPVYSVSGFGMVTYLRGDDLAEIDSLADPVLHAERLAGLLPAPPPPPAGPSIPEQVGAALHALDPTTATVVQVLDALTPIFPAPAP